MPCGGEAFGVSARDRLALRALELFACLRQSVDVELAGVRELVDRPGGNRRLLQLLDTGGDRALSLAAEAANEVVAESRELVERSRVEAVELLCLVDQAACFARLPELRLPLRPGRCFFAAPRLARSASMRSGCSASSAAGATWTSLPCCFALTTFFSAAV